MTIEEACTAIMGKPAADKIMSDMGIHWLVVGAMSQASSKHPPEAIATIRRWNAEQKALTS